MVTADGINFSGLEVEVYVWKEPPTTTTTFTTATTITSTASTTTKTETVMQQLQRLMKDQVAEFLEEQIRDTAQKVAALETKLEAEKVKSDRLTKRVGELEDKLSAATAQNSKT